MAGTWHLIADDLSPEAPGEIERELIRRIELLLARHAAFDEWLVAHHR